MRRSGCRRICRIEIPGELPVDTHTRAELAATVAVMVITTPCGETEVVHNIPDIFHIGGIDVSFLGRQSILIRIVLDRGKRDEHIWI